MVEVSSGLITTLLYPILTAVGLLLVLNICIFPEFSSSFLGITTIETLGETVAALRNAGKYFIYVDRTPGGKLEPEPEEIRPEIGQHTTAETPTEKHGPASSVSFIIARFLARVGLQMRTNEENNASESITSKKHSKVIKLKSLTDQKPSLRVKLDECKDAQDECNFELAFAVLPLRELKPVSETAMKKLVANTIALIGVCESKYAFIGNQDDSGEDYENGRAEIVPTTAENYTSQKHLADGPGVENGEETNEEGKSKKQSGKTKGKSKLERQIADLEPVKPHKEIEFGDIELLRVLAVQISQSVLDLQEKIDKTVDVISYCLAYCYDVPELPNGSRPPKGIKLEEIDIWVDIFTSAIADFDNGSALALENTTAIHDLEGPQIDIMPRIEIFLISSFILNLRQAALQIHHLLTHARKLVEKRQSKHERRRLYAPRLEWREWLTSGGEQDMMSLPSKGLKDARTGLLSESSEKNLSTGSIKENKDNLLKKQDDEEVAAKYSKAAATKPNIRDTPTAKDAKNNGTMTHRIRNQLADAVEWALSSEDVLYSIKLTVAVFLVTWRAFLSNWNYWYYSNCGLWAALQLILVMEVSIGNSIFIFILRAVGTTIGCLWGWAAYEAGGGDRVVCVVILAIGIIPSAYVQLSTEYVKVGMVSIISMCVVALATEDQTVTGTATDIFLKRWIAFLIGGFVALMVELILFPVKARDRLVESLVASIRHISDIWKRASPVELRRSQMLMCVLLRFLSALTMQETKLKVHLQQQGPFYLSAPRSQGLKVPLLAWLWYTRRFYFYYTKSWTEWTICYN